MHVPNQKYKHVGNFFRKARKSRGLSKERLSEIAEISARHLSNLERGHINPTWDTMQRLLAVIPSDANELMYPNRKHEKVVDAHTAELLATLGSCNEADQEKLMSIARLFLCN
jgi:transcriptional regulator with XRE-family HTH domain